MLQLHSNKNINLLWWRIIGIAALAGLLYYSWPLGYWLNPLVGKQGLASDLGAKGQPYSWLFTLLDVISGALILLVTLWLAKAWQQFMNLSVKLILWGYGLFGVLTAASAVLPINCLPDEGRCSNWLTNPMLILHGLTSIGSIAGLTISIIGIWQLLVITKRGATHWRWVLHGIMLIWFSFGLLTLMLILTARSSNTAQHVFITVCSVWTVLMPYILVHLHNQELEFVRAIDTENK